MNSNELVETAAAETGLDDPGAEPFREGLDMLVEALEASGTLSELGQVVVRSHLLRLLANRFRIEECYRKHPEIDEQTTPAPIVILGLPRTGTTALSARLARDPGTRSLLAWESGAPTPPPETATRETDPRIEQTRAGMAAMHAAFPDMKKMYDAEATDPTECQDLLGMAFQTHHFCGQYWIPDYEAWLMDRDMTGAYRTHQRTLKLLQWRCPPNRWQLKTPVHMLSLDSLDRVYPDARFIMTHRDPATVLGSLCALIRVTRSMASKKDDPHRIGREQLAVWPLALERAMAFRKRVAKDRFTDVFFTEQLGDPVGVVERAYAKLGLPFTDAVRTRMASWAESRQRGRQGSYHYRLEDFGLDAGGVRERFQPYLERFAIPLEEAP